MPPLLSIAEALARVLARVRPLESELVPVAESAGRVLAEDVAALIDLPPFPSSAMDGFAIRAADVPGELPIVFRIAAGRPAERALEAGEAMEISTGGTVPAGSDTVVPIENVVEHDNNVQVPDAVTPGAHIRPIVFRIAAGRPAERALEAGEAMEISTGGTVPAGSDTVVPIENVVEHDNNVKVPDSVTPGAHIRPIGGDVRAGDALLAAGTVLGAAQIGALAAAGIVEVSCSRRPRVVVLSTGTELRAPGESLGPGQIYESNGAMLAAAFEAAGALVDRIGPVVDDEDEHRRALEWGLEADVLVSSGGVSVGPHDLVRRILGELGAEEDFWGVAVRPGKPLAFATRGATLVFGLPGNPVSALVAVELFVRPALRALQGDSSPGPNYATARLASSVHRNAARDELVRARTARDGDEIVLEPVSGQESHMIARAAGADALVLVLSGEGELAAGELARYLPLS